MMAIMSCDSELSKVQVSSSIPYITPRVFACHCERSPHLRRHLRVCVQSTLDYTLLYTFNTLPQASINTMAECSFGLTGR